MSAGAWEPVRVLDLDLLAPSTHFDARGPGGRLHVLLRLHSHNVGVVELDLAADEPLAGRLEGLRALCAPQIRQHQQLVGCAVTWAGTEPPCLARRRERLREAPPISVLIATHDRPQHLARCLDAVLTQSHRALDVVVVDNARSSDETERMLRAERYAGVTYVRDDVPGLGRAHNTGLEHARGEILAITDDDVVPDHEWLAALAEVFVEEAAGCVTGLILPLELRTREQAWVEQHGGFARGFERRVYSTRTPPEGDPLFPFTAGRFGSGANMAFSRRALERIGGFDPALGAGTRAMGGDDLAAFAATLLAGETLIYQPDALVKHLHHDHYAAVRRMAHGYGVGLGAYLTSLVATRPSLLFEIIRRVPAGLSHLSSPDSAKNRNIQADYPQTLVRTERLGLLKGPFSYVASRRRIAAQTS